MAINKVVYNNNTLVDLTSDNVAQSDVRSGVYFHTKDGVRRQGTSSAIVPSGNINIATTNQVNVTNYATAQVVDSNLVAGNIKSGVNILGTVGTYSGGGGGGTQTVTLSSYNYIDVYNIEYLDANGLHQNLSNITISPATPVTLNILSNSSILIKSYLLSGFNIISGAAVIYRTAISNIILVITPSEDTILSLIGDCCFAPETLVLMADGSTKQIIEVQIGDKVKSYNEELHIIENAEVVRIITHENTTNMARITLNNGTQFEFNEYHPLYTQDGWKSLTEHNGLPLLTMNDYLLNSDNILVPISNIETWTLSEGITTYNLDVEDNDNFFVGDSKGQFVLAHNIC